MNPLRHLLTSFLFFIAGAFLVFSLYKNSEKLFLNGSIEKSSLSGIRGVVERVEKDALVVLIQNYSSLPVIPEKETGVLKLRISTKNALVIGRREEYEGKNTSDKYRALSLADLSTGQAVYIKLSQYDSLQSVIIEIRDQNNILANL